MISEWGVIPLVQQGGSSPTMISEWSVTPPPFCNRVVQIKKVYISMTLNNNNINWVYYLTCRLPPQVKILICDTVCAHLQYDKFVRLRETGNLAGGGEKRRRQPVSVFLPHVCR